MAHHLHEFQDKEVTVKEKFADGSSSGRTIRLKIKVKTTKTEGKHWGPEDCGFARSPYDFLAVGCLEVPEGNHAVFIKYYNPQTRMVKTINSHDQEGELGAKKDGWVRDANFHNVNSIQLTLYTSRKPLRHLLATRVPSCEEPGLLMSRPAKSPGRSCPTPSNRDEMN